MHYDASFTRYEYLAGVLATHLDSDGDDQHLQMLPYVGRLDRSAMFLPQDAATPELPVNDLVPVLVTDTDDPHTAWQAAVDAYDRQVQSVRQERLFR